MPSKEPLVFGIVSTDPNKHDLIRDLMLHAHQTGRSLYVYRPDALRRMHASPNGTVRALLLDPAGKRWRSVQAPLPSVLLRKYEYGSLEADQKSSIQHGAVPLIPLASADLVRDKYRFSQVMANASVPHPETRLFTPENIQDMLDEHGQVMVKDRKGSLGRSILRVSDAGAGRCRIEFQDSGKNKTQTVARERIHDAVRRIIRGFSRADPAGYLVQTCIPGPKFEGERFSMRLLMHRTDDGLVLTSALARVASNGSFLDNVACGGKVVAHDVVLNRVFGGKASQVHSAMLGACRKAFEAVESETRMQSSLPLGELGFDVIFHSDGRPVVLEANSRPGTASTPFYRHYPENAFRAGEHAYRQATRRER